MVKMMDTKDTKLTNSLNTLGYEYLIGFCMLWAWLCDVVLKTQTSIQTSIHTTAFAQMDELKANACSKCPASPPHLALLWCRTCNEFIHEYCHAVQVPDGADHSFITEKEFFYNQNHMKEARRLKGTIFDAAVAVKRTGQKVVEVYGAVSSVVGNGVSGGVGAAVSTSLSQLTPIVAATTHAMIGTNAIIAGSLAVLGIACAAGLLYCGKITKYEFVRSVACHLTSAGMSVGFAVAGAAVGGLGGPLGVVIGGIIGGFAGGLAAHFVKKKFIDKLFPGPEELAAKQALREAKEYFKVGEEVTLEQSESTWKDFARIYHPDKRTGIHEEFCKIGAFREILIEFVVERDGLEEGAIPRLESHYDRLFKN